ncbi:thiamine pyrophosphate-binding protein [Novosphingobium sp. FSY-8]|uniref:Thiamine pyrophosphate-binding protein n=1 Tax=Novosphingobium ovatum TaxID=1908523 RepID=A0ABW9XEZ7_9SPHN|nr:thiamine pyrophosphate-binding protein [Novosphingobium ovatum]NBC37101.1 thiamine pyrophosphate-binding protein [Novosphingobium ovatum]
MSRGLDVVLSACAAAGIDTLFGIPDPQFFALFQAAGAQGWTVVAPHHEAAGGFMAEGAARISGRPALCVGTMGPGVANLLPAMAHALAEHVPVLFLGGARDGSDETAQTGRFQQFGQMAAARPCVKWAGRATSGADLGAVLTQALAAMRQGTPGPVYVEITGAAWDQPAVWEPPVTEAQMPDIQAVVDMVAQAQCPVILSGHGVQTARMGAAVADLACHLGAPIILTPGGAAVAEAGQSRAFPYGFSAVTREVIAAADLVIALGTALGDTLHFGTGRHWAAGHTARRWVQVEADAATIGRHRRIDAALVADLRVAVPALRQGLTGRGDHPGLAGWIAARNSYHLQQKEAALAASSSPLHPARLVRAVADAMPPNAIHVRDGGALALYDLALRGSLPGDVLWSQNMGHLGTGLPMAVGAVLATGGRRVASVLTGDSALMFHLAELEVAARLRLPIVCVVGVDHQWGLEVGMAQRLNVDPALPALYWGAGMRFDRLAQAMGCSGLYVDQADMLENVLEQAFAIAQTGGPVVVHAALDAAAHARDIPALGEFASWFTPPSP